MNIKDDISKALNEASKATEHSIRSRLDEFFQPYSTPPSY